MVGSLLYLWLFYHVIRRQRKDTALLILKKIRVKGLSIHDNLLDPYRRTSYGVGRFCPGSAKKKTVVSFMQAKEKKQGSATIINSILRSTYIGLFKTQK